MATLFRIGSLFGIALLLSPACVVKLAERNAPELNGGVTGADTDCSQIKALPPGAAIGEAAPKFVGRFDLSQPGAARFDWSGNHIAIRFEGTDRVTVRLEALPRVQNVPQDQMFSFVLDGEQRIVQVTVKTDPSGRPSLTPQEEYDVDGIDPNGSHELVVYKNTEAQGGGVVFKGFDLNGGRALPSIRRARRIEFIGDSIICGYGNRGLNATCPYEIPVREAYNADGTRVINNGIPYNVSVPVTEDQYQSFTAIAARELDADAVTVCWSGRGVYLNYKEREGEERAESLVTVPMFWKRTLGNDAERPWDFAAEKPEEKPQVVVVSLGTNDFARDNKPETSDPNKLSGDNLPDGDLDSPDQREIFFEKYLGFVRDIRANRPQAHIFLATPPMVTDQFPLVDARKHLREALLRIVEEQNNAGDSQVYQMDLVEQGFRYGLGCDYHPNLEVHRIMATQLTGAIRSKTCW